MAKLKLGYSLPKIEETFSYLLDHKVSEADGSYHVPVGGKMEQYPVFKVPLELPRYRLDNTRTLHLQRKYISENNLPETYFEDEIWSDELQEIQHGILSTLINKKDLKEYFEKNEQTDPLILTHDGFVVSGNRRLCAYRELYSSENGVSKFKRFERLRVVILPRLTEEEIEFIEDFLEQQPDIKDEFSWIARAMGFRKRMKKHNYSTGDIAKKNNLKKSEIDSLLDNLTLAEQYLKHVGREGDYELVEKNEFAFKEIEKGRRKFKHHSSKRDLFEKLSYIALQYQEKIGGRMYSNIPIIQENLDSIEEEIVSEF